MHWKVHYKNVSRITNGSHMSNTTRLINVQSRFPTLIGSLDKTVGKVSTFEVIIASLPSPLLQCCAKLNGFSGKLLTYLPTLNRGEGGYVRESETISFEL